MSIGAVGRILLTVILAASLGTLVIVGPAFFYAASPHEAGPYLPIVARAIKALQPAIVLPLLVLTGFVTAFVTRQRSFGSALVVAIATILPLQVWSILDMMLGDPRTERHSLLPFEWLFYLGLGLFAGVGAVVATFKLRKEAIVHPPTSEPVEHR